MVLLKKSMFQHQLKDPMLTPHLQTTKTFFSLIPLYYSLFPTHNYQAIDMANF
jgi:hypothetical protein